ncbi:MAG: TrkH family potassium uptake protein [Eubacteriales bacterium]|nr:TrkH family potassium uptake protein [Lachnospiraceae bacterium]MDO5128228.1 TrkH family potassium uptake protein [Eubacteriales bacterium]
MNYKMIGKYISRILFIEAVLMVPALLISLVNKNSKAVVAFIATIGIILALVLVLHLSTKDAKRMMYAREGFVCVGFSWIFMSLLGCMPFVISGEIPKFIDAFFETVSGFTTTGASILSNVEGLSKGMLYWRSFTHWIGGMGVLVFLLALASSKEGDGFTMHLLRAESPGPDVGKLVPHIKETAKILYLIYILLTILDYIFLLIGNMPAFDAICTAFGTAGTGGFGIKNDSIAGYSPYIQNVCTIFMLLFGVNFSCYYLLLLKQFKSVFKDEELRMYVIMVGASICAIAWNIKDMYTTISESFRHASFQVASVVTTTGFATTDFDLWPSFSKAILLCLMLVGACAGSTGGGLKCGRALLLIKSLRKNIHQAIRPNKVQVITNNGRVVNQKVLQNTQAYLAAYVMIIVGSFVVISLDGQSMMTNLSAVIACFNNIGPGFEAVGATCNYAAYSIFSKLILIIDMLAGRLEIFPILVLFTRSTWKHR